LSTARDYYEILGVERSASRDDLRRKYRELALQFHPDRNKEAHAEERFKEISEAYAVLSDPEKRAAYDRFGHAGVDQRWATEEDLYRGADINDVLRGFGLHGFEDLFANLFGGGFAQARRGRDVQAGVRLTLKEVMEGAKRTLEVPRHRACKACGGSGAKAGTSRTTCATCRGSGQVRVERRGGVFQFVQVAPCRDCRGQGSRLASPCAECRGLGIEQHQAEVELELPAGLEHGQVLRVRGGGDAGPGGLPPGDLLVVVEVEPHPDFERRGFDLLTATAVPFATAALGGNVEVTLPDGSTEKVHLRPGTQGGTLLTLSGKGIRAARGRRGDVHVLVQVAVPTKLNARQRELVEAMAQEEGGANRKPPLLKGLLRGLGLQD